MVHLRSKRVILVFVSRYCCFFCFFLWVLYQSIISSTFNLQETDVYDYSLKLIAHTTLSCRRCEQLSRSRIGSRSLPLPKLYAPYTDNRENQQSRNYRNLDILAPADDYSRSYDNAHFTTVKRDTAASALRARTETSLPPAATSRTSLPTSHTSSRNESYSSSLLATPQSAQASRSRS